MRRFSGDATGDIAAALGFTLFQPVLAPVLGALSPQGAAARAGMQPRDRIVAINGQPVRHWGDLVKRVRNGPGKRLVFRLYRGDVLHRVTVVPAAVSAGEGKTIGQIGAAPYVAPDAWRALTATARYGPAQALSRALARTWDTALFSLRMLGRMLTGGVSWKNLSGPLTIADYAGQTAHLGWLPYLSFLALISISLGVLNLLPIPLLDGGHLMYYIVEIFTGKPVSDRAMEIGQQIGMAILLLLMLFAFYNDINRLIAG
ncbi:MAG TPA: RIP metalloprotease RseP [Betaproteobacteria bacterium]|nr:RIP metalloprotease RseP [Betaproteobacteria bacterium]